MNKPFFFALTLMLSAFAASAQDTHFSQYFASPLTLNPALAGFFDGKYRVGVQYRGQWDAAMKPANGYRTISTSLDMKFPFKIRKDAIGAGLVFYDDKVGMGRLGTTYVALAGAFTKALDMYGENLLSAGFQFGAVQKSFTYDNLSFNDQFNGYSGYTLPSGEVLPRNAFTYGDLSAGLTWAYTPASSRSVYLGLSGHHVNRPNVAFNIDEGAQVSTLPIKLSLIAGGKLRMGDNRSHSFVMPRLLMHWQGQHLEANAGSSFRASLTPYGDMAMHLGIWGRAVRDTKFPVTFDGLVFLMGFELKGFNLGLSYDLNLSDVTRSAPRRSAFEISATYIGEFEDNTIVCPTF